MQIHQTASFSFSFLPYTEAHVRYGSGLSPLYNMILWLTLYDINLVANFV